jgi:5'-nucleotidase
MNIEINKMKSRIFTILLLAFFNLQIVAAPLKENEIQLTFIHLNDVYEITPVSGGKLGGLARIATLKKQLLADNPNTYITFSGDLYGPSGLSNVAKLDGELLAGRQAVAVMNLVGIDYSIFGDHEFDQFSAEQVLKRIKETRFPIIASNINAANGMPLENTIKQAIFSITTADGEKVKVGLFGITEPIHHSDLKLNYTDAFKVAKQKVMELDKKVDILIALTHFKSSLDKKLAQRFPQIDLILGGDDHEHMSIHMGAGLASIYKSDSNARNVQIIDLIYDTSSKQLRINDRLQPITDAISDDVNVQTEVKKWVKLGFDSLRGQGINAEQVVMKTVTDLDGFATSIRNHPTALTQLIMSGINYAVPKADLGILSSGIIRLDDTIGAGYSFTEYDVIRTFPSDFRIVSMIMSGDKLKKVLDNGQKNRGTGDFLLHTTQVKQGLNHTWLIDGKPLQLTKNYQVACVDVEVKPLGGQLSYTSDHTLRKAFIHMLQMVAH